VEASLKRASDVVATLLTRRSGVGPGDVVPPREPELPHNWSEKLAFRKRPKPYSRAIPWSPRSVDSPPDRSRPYELFVSQSVLRQVRGHLITAKSGEPYGFLLGQVVYCPWSESPYIVIDAVRRESQNLPPANDMDRFRHAWVGAARDARHRRGEVIGWYHRHGVLGLRLSEWDIHLQEEFFPEAWHCALIVASTSRGIIGGFIQRSPRARLFRKGLAPFHELVDLDAKLVDGRKPSFVDWENYAAGEPVSVLKAKWPTPQTRLARWKSPDHADEGADPERPAAAAGARPAPGSRGLRGRSWRTGQETRKDVPPRPVREAGFSEEFTGAVARPALTGPEARAKSAPGTIPDGAAGTGVGPPDGVEAPPDGAGAETRRSRPARKPAAGRARGKKRKGSAASKTAATGTAATDEAEAEKPAKEDGARDTEAVGVESEQAGAQDATGGPDDAWYTPEFLEAVWGAPPFEPEVSEPSTDEGTAAQDAAPAGTGADAARSPSKGRADRRRGRAGRRPAFELVAPFDAEPSETEPPGSLEWLHSLLDEVPVSTPSAGSPEDEASPAAMEGARELEDAGAAATDGDATVTEDEPPETPVETDDADIGLEAAEAAIEAGGVGPGSADDASAPQRERERHIVPGQRSLVIPAGGGARPASKSRPTFVAASQNPEIDREAEIPVVLFHDRQPWRPSPRLRRVAAGLAIVAAGTLAWRSFGDRGTPVAPPAPAAQPASVTSAESATPEFVELADAYLSGLQSYRQRVVQHQLGQVDCEQLTSDFSVLVLAHRALAEYVATTPAMVERFARLDAELGPARERFEASGCPLSPDLDTAPPGEGSTGQAPSGD